MSTIQEEVTIKAPAGSVWTVVHEEMENWPLWSTHLRSAEVVGGGKPRKGSRLRYAFMLPGGKEIGIEMLQTVFERPVRCAGEVVKGPISGTWSWDYRESRGKTRLRYTMEMKLGGVLRLAGGVITDQYAKSMQDTLLALKEYVESR